MEPVYIIGAGAIGKVLAVFLGNFGKIAVLLRGSVDNGETHREKIRVTLPSSQPLSTTDLNFNPVAVSPIGRIIGGDENSLRRIASVLNTPDFCFRAELDIQPIIWKKAIVNSVFNSVCPLLDTGNGIFHRNPLALQIAESLVAECLRVAEEQGINRPTEIATLNLAIAGMAKTEQEIIQTHLLGQLILLKSQITKS